MAPIPDRPATTSRQSLTESSQTGPTLSRPVYDHSPGRRDGVAHVGCCAIAAYRVTLWIYHHIRRGYHSNTSMTSWNTPRQCA